MWTRELLKYNAKQELKQSYLLSFAVCLVAGILGGGSVGGGSVTINFNNISNNNNTFSGYINDPAVIMFIIVVLLIVVAFSFCFSFFVGGPITVGKSAFFVRCVRGFREFENLFSSFKKGYYIKTCKTMFFMNLEIFLWSLLFVIPGIIKSYEYRMVPYLLSDNPDLSTREALRMSREMMDGEKLNTWVLDLSFIGWRILGTLVFFIGNFLVTPYVEATNAQLYFALCAKMDAMFPPQQPMEYPMP